jgi:hypothetical protein
VHRYYYGTVPVLAWIINHYFYGGLHYSWLADAFHPHRDNPGSSNPYLIYGDLYVPWQERDRYSRFVTDYRRSLEEGVAKKEETGVIDNITAARLKRVCKLGSVELFYPVLYRVDMDEIAPSRRAVENSGLEGSHEFLVPDLRESEFDLLLTDNRRDRYFPEVVPGKHDEVPAASALPVLALLETMVTT